MNEFQRAALRYARRGWRVFPVHGIVRGRCTCGRRGCSSPGKHPLVRGGVHTATSELDAVTEWWARWQRANVAVATGAVSGIVVIDIDLPRALPALDVLLARALERTLVGLTGGGGLHLVFSSSDRSLRNRASRVPGIGRDLPGVDLRANGGYVVVPPSIHASGRRYTWFDPATPLAPAPTWLEEAPRPSRPPVPMARVRDLTNGGTPYGLTALRNELDRLRRAPLGNRNHQLNRSAFTLGHLVAAGYLEEERVRESLLETSRLIGLTEWESHRTIESGLRAGFCR